MGQEFLDRKAGCLVAIWLCLAAVPAVGSDSGQIDFNGAPIVVGEHAADLETLAARELQRYLRHVSPKRRPSARRRRPPGRAFCWAPRGTMRGSPLWLIPVHSRWVRKPWARKAS